MKRKLRPSRPRPPAEPLPAPRAALPTRRVWLFRLLAITLIPALLFAGLELGLRLANYGYPTGFFRKTQIAGRAVYVENDKFGLRFFPPALTRVASPIVMPATKPTNTCRIFILGESAALGDPEPAFGFGRYLETLLRERYPDKQFEVVCAAMTAINSHALLPIARDCARRDGDLWVIYMGNNEVVGPFGAGTVLGPRSPSLFSIRASLALKTTRLGQLLDALIDRVLPTPPVANSWQGMKMFMDAQTRPTEPNRRRTDEHFRKNLEAMLRVAQGVDVPVILCTVASNLKDCAPFASLHPAQFPESRKLEWEQKFDAGVKLETAGKWDAAIQQYQTAAALDDGYAELQFRLGRCHLARNQNEEARRCFERARDFDALPFRATSTMNTIIQEAGHRFADAGVTLLDAEQGLAQSSPHNINGNEFFYEHVHLNNDGNYELARLVAGQAARLVPMLRSQKESTEWAPAATCDERLCVTPWDRHRIYENLRQRESQPPFTLQLDHAKQMQLIAGDLTQSRSKMTPDAVEPARALYRQALRSQPDDFILCANFAKLLEDTGDPTGAVAEWQRTVELLPYHFGPGYYLGKLLARLGRNAEAEQQLTRALQLRPDTVEVMDELGQVLAAQKKPAAALAQFHRALALQPDNARLHFHLAQALLEQNQIEPGVASLRRAVQSRPDYWEAQYLLGVELAMAGNLAEARDHLSETVRLKPDYAGAHLNLGVALAKLNHLPEAISQFRETLRLDPSNTMALDYLTRLRAPILP